MLIKGKSGTLEVGDKFVNGQVRFNAAIYDYQGQAYLDREGLTQLKNHIESLTQLAKGSE